MRQEDLIEQRVVVLGLQDDFRCPDLPGKIACSVYRVAHSRAARADGPHWFMA
jgi:hypothetical protein